MAELMRDPCDPREVILERACDLLVQIAHLHVMARRRRRNAREEVCGICAIKWPCRTYRYATGDIE